MNEHNEHIDKLILEAQTKLNWEVDVSILEQFFSLINMGVLEVRSTSMRSEFNKENCNLNLSKCIGVDFKGSSAFAKLQQENTLLKKAYRVSRESNLFYGDTENWSGMVGDIHRAIFNPPIDNEYDLDDKFYPNGFICGKKARAVSENEHVILADKIMEEKL